MNEPQKISPNELAKRWRIDVQKVLKWIKSGELLAINVALTTDKRQQYRIDERDIEDFERRRAASVTKTAQRQSADVKKRRKLLSKKEYV
jgi:hypothetical protein